MKINWCCGALNNLVQDAGKAGLAAVCETGKHNRRIKLQSRGIPANWEELMNKGDSFPIQVNAGTETIMKYCPYCGFELIRIIRKNEKAFDKIALEHKKYIIHHMDSF